MSRYAANTEVSSDRSKSEIERTLRQYGAGAFAYATTTTEARVMFQMAERNVLFVLPMPDPNADEFRLTPSKRQRRSPAAQEAAYEQAIRQRWRALALVIKAKLEAVETGITTVEQEFLAHIVLPNGSRVAEWLAPQLARAYATQEMPALLPGSTG